MAAFALPVFNLACNVWHNPTSRMDHLPVPSASVFCNLANGRVSHLPGWVARQPGTPPSSYQSSALFPIGTDIRDTSVHPNPDIVEIPAGTGRYYWVVYCDDIAKGFTNEHRWAVIQKVYGYGIFSIYHWPTPMP